MKKLFVILITLILSTAAFAKCGELEIPGRDGKLAFCKIKIEELKKSTSGNDALEAFQVSYNNMASSCKCDDKGNSQDLAGEGNDCSGSRTIKVIRDGNKNATGVEFSEAIEQ